ncbi:hypothetical protein KC219_21650, partial [Mycobacterium tuberculosis]|nr:hypothetical protein [Mycobacterium tuberculosis]
MRRQLNPVTACLVVLSCENVESGCVMTDSGNAVTPPVGGALSDIAKKISETRFTLQTDDAADGRRLLGSLSSATGDGPLPRRARARAALPAG